MTIRIKCDVLLSRKIHRNIENNLEDNLQNLINIYYLISLAIGVHLRFDQ